ncbi:hypothetical protein LSAT2_004675 [Lamellibrachia satsuma]|nr:hypothetical protein LSAT2_004675 [Lamellibrachia satsuma]
MTEEKANIAETVPRFSAFIGKAALGLKFLLNNVGKLTDANTTVLQECHCHELPPPAPMPVERNDVTSQDGHSFDERNAKTALTSRERERTPSPTGSIPSKPAATDFSSDQHQTSYFIIKLPRRRTTRIRLVPERECFARSLPWICSKISKSQYLWECVLPFDKDVR